MRDRTSGLILTAPLLALAAVFFIAPLLWVTASSFLQFDIRMRATWAGLANFVNLMQPQALRAFGVSAFFGLIAGMATIATALVGGLALSQFPGRWWAAFQISSMFAGVNTSILWVWLFHPILGGANSILGAFGVMPIAWHAQEWPARLAVLLVIWAWCFPGNVYFVAMSARAVPKELLEAARLDGATAWQEFWHVVLPVIRRPLALMVTSTLSQLLLVYEAPTMLWRGGPLGATSTVLMRVVEWSQAVGKYGLASATSLVVIVLSVPLCLTAWRMGNREAT